MILAGYIFIAAIIGLFFGYVFGVGVERFYWINSAHKSRRVQREGAFYRVNFIEYMK